jgi:hypothetical protein
MNQYPQPCKDVKQFLDEYYKPDRYTGRGPEYAALLLASHQAEYDGIGSDIISHHDSAIGQAMIFKGGQVYIFGSEPR